MFQYQQADNTTFWFAPGTHTLGSSQFSQIQSGNNDTFIGAPGAIIDGQGTNAFAIVANSGVTGVTVKYLTIQDFAPQGTQGVLNVNGTAGWTIEYNTLQNNIPGTAVGLGTNNTMSYNCITGSGEYAFNAYSAEDVSPVTGGPSNITMTYNEMSFNDVCNYENFPNFPISPPSGCPAPSGGLGDCGCSGAGKFWEVDGADVSDNYVHDNYNVGLWADTNNTGFNFSGNYLQNNFSEGIMYEISYNAQVQNNIFVDNDWGQARSGAISGFPGSALYLSESGSDSRVAGSYGTAFDVTGNKFYDNWGGINLYENPDRYCTSPGNSSAGVCTLVNPSVANLTTCDYQGSDIQTTPYIDDCRWKTQNVQVSGNLFDFSPSDIGADCTTGNFCGFNGVFSAYGSISPFVGTAVENHITFSQGNAFSGNTYCGPWHFDALAQGNVYSFATWQGSPYNQDAGSTMNGPSCT